MNRSLKRRLERVEEALGPDPSLDELYSSIIWRFALTTDETSLKLVKQAFATVLGRPAEQEEEAAKEKEPPASPPPSPPPPSASEAEPPPPEATVDPLCQPPPQWVEVRWRPRGEPDPYDQPDDDDGKLDVPMCRVDYDQFPEDDD